MPTKRPKKLLHALLQLSLFDFEPFAPAVSPSTPLPPSPATPDKSGRKRQLLAGSHLIEYRLRRSKRRSIGFLIEEEGLRVTAPRWVTLAEIEDAIRDKHRWIIEKLDEHREYQIRKKATVWREGETIAYLGRTYTLRLQPAEPSASSVAPDDAAGTLAVSLPEESDEAALKTCLENWLRQEALRIFSDRLPIFAAKLGVSYHSVALSSATTQWGSCTAHGLVRLNWRLIHLPQEIIDYVIAHELSHLREMNHSSRFWDTVQSVFPAYREAREALRNHSPCALRAI